MRPSAAAFLAVVLLSAAATGVAATEVSSRAAAQGGTQGRAHVEKTFLIPGAEGYGVGECLTDGKTECGQVVADAWCESQGYASAVSYGVAAQDEYTGAIETAPVVKAADRPIRITCQD